jgi:hypothetical protein
MPKTTKRTYIITCEWPETYGPEWMNPDNLILTLNKGCPSANWAVLTPPPILSEAPDARDLEGREDGMPS